LAPPQADRAIIAAPPPAPPASPAPPPSPPAPPPAPPSPPPETRLPLPRAAYYALAVLQSASASGAFFGFSSFARVLVLDGAFASLCSSAPGPGGCAAQQERLADLYSYAALLALTTPVLSGLLSDRLGPRFALRCFAATFVAGAALLAFAAGARNDAAYAPGVLLLGASASANLLPLYNVAELFPLRRGLAISVLSGSFDFGSIVFVVVAALYDAGVPLGTILLAYVCGPAALMALLSAFVWRTEPFRSAPSPPPEASGDAPKPAAAAALEASPGSPAEPVQARAPQLVLLPAAATTPLPSRARRHGGRRIGLEGAAAGEVPGDEGAGTDEEGDGEAPETPLVASPRAAAAAAAAAAAVAAAAAATVAAPEQAAARVLAVAGSVSALPPAPLSAAERFLPGIDVERLKGLSFFRQVQTPHFYLFVAAFCIFNLRLGTYLANIGSFLDALGQVDGASTRIFGAILPCGFASVVGAGLLLDARGPVPAFAVLSALCVAVSAISLVPALAVQPLAFAAFAAFRGFLFSTATSYLALVFGFENLGLLMGTLTCCGGLFTLQQVYWTRWALSRGFAEPNALHLVLGLVSFGWAAWLRLRGRGGTPK